MKPAWMKVWVGRMKVQMGMLPAPTAKAARSAQARRPPRFHVSHRLMSEAPAEDTYSANSPPVASICHNRSLTDEATKRLQESRKTQSCVVYCVLVECQIAKESFESAWLHQRGRYGNFGSYG